MISASATTYSKSSLTRKDSHQSVHPSYIARVLFYPSLHSPKTVEGTVSKD